MIEYTDNLERVNEEMLDGFFAGWLNPPSRAKHMEILKGSYAVWIAIDTHSNKVVGFISAVSDGVLSAYIPLLEVLPEYRHAGIGTGLVTRMLETLNKFYMVDLICDENLQGFYAKLGMRHANGMMIRNYNG